MMESAPSGPTTSTRTLVEFYGQSFDSFPLDYKTPKIQQYAKTRQHLLSHLLQQRRPESDLQSSIDYFANVSALHDQNAFIHGQITPQTFASEAKIPFSASIIYEMLPPQYSIAINISNPAHSVSLACASEIIDIPGSLDELSFTSALTKPLLPDEETKTCIEQINLPITNSGSQFLSAYSLLESIPRGLRTPELFVAVLKLFHSFHTEAIYEFSRVREDDAPPAKPLVNEALLEEFRLVFPERSDDEIIWAWQNQRQMELEIIRTLFQNSDFFDVSSDVDASRHHERNELLLKLLNQLTDDLTSKAPSVDLNVFARDVNLLLNETKMRLRQLVPQEMEIAVSEPCEMSSFSQSRRPTSTSLLDGYAPKEILDTYNILDRAHGTERACLNPAADPYFFAVAASLKLPPDDSRTTHYMDLALRESAPNLEDHTPKHIQSEFFCFHLVSIFKTLSHIEKGENYEDRQKFIQQKYDLDSRAFFEQIAQFVLGYSPDSTTKNLFIALLSGVPPMGEEDQLKYDALIYNTPSIVRDAAIYRAYLCQDMRIPTETLTDRITVMPNESDPANPTIYFTDQPLMCPSFLFYQAIAELFGIWPGKALTAFNLLLKKAGEMHFFPESPFRTALSGALQASGIAPEDISIIAEDIFIQFLAGLRSKAFTEVQKKIRMQLEKDYAQSATEITVNYDKKRLCDLMHAYVFQHVSVCQHARGRAWAQRVMWILIPSSLLLSGTLTAALMEGWLPALSIEHGPNYFMTGGILAATGLASWGDRKLRGNYLDPVIPELTGSFLLLEAKDNKGCCSSLKNPIMKRKLLIAYTFLGLGLTALGTQDLIFKALTFLFADMSIDTAAGLASATFGVSLAMIPPMPSLWLRLKEGFAAYHARGPVPAAIDPDAVTTGLLHEYRTPALPLYREDQGSYQGPAAAIFAQLNFNMAPPEVTDAIEEKPGHRRDHGRPVTTLSLNRQPIYPEGAGLGLQ